MARPTNELRRLGLCVQCKKQPRTRERASCPECLEKTRVRCTARKRVVFAQRRALGQCVKCGVPNDNGKGHCPSCLAKRVTRTRMLESRRQCLRCRTKLKTALKYCGDCLRLYGERHKVFAQRLKREVMERYGGASCSCCGETHEAFLTVDHVHGGGRKHREATTKGKGGEAFYRWLKQQDFPAGYRVLCFNCNFAIWRLGTCPHQARLNE